MTATTTTPTTLKRHPIRGILYGIVFGLGLAFIAIGQKWAALGTWPPFILFLIGIVVGFVWSTFGPAKKPKGPAPGEAPASPPTAADMGMAPETEMAGETDVAADTAMVADTDAPTDTAMVADTDAPTDTAWPADSTSPADSAADVDIGDDTGMGPGGTDATSDDPPREI